MLRLKDQPKTLGDYTLIRKHKNMLIVKYMEATSPTQIFAVKFKQLSGTISDFDNLDVTLIEQNKFDDSQLSQELLECIAGLKSETIELENGADAFFMYP